MTAARKDVQCHACGTWSLASLPVCPGALGLGGCGAKRLHTMTALHDLETALATLESLLWRVSSSAHTEGLRATEAMMTIAHREHRLLSDTIALVRAAMMRDASTGKQAA